MRAIRVKVKEMEGKKEDHLARLKAAQKGKDVLERFVAENIDVLSRAMKKEYVDALLAWYNVPPTQECLLIADRRKKWKEVSANPPPVEELWTSADEAQLMGLKTYKIDMSQTAFGRLKLRKKMKMKAPAKKMSVSDRQELIKNCKI